MPKWGRVLCEPRAHWIVQESDFSKWQPSGWGSAPGHTRVSSRLREQLRIWKRAPAYSLSTCRKPSSIGPWTATGGMAKRHAPLGSVVRIARVGAGSSVFPFGRCVVKNSPTACTAWKYLVYCKSEKAGRTFPARAREGSAFAGSPSCGSEYRLLNTDLCKDVRFASGSRDQETLFPHSSFTPS